MNIDQIIATARRDARCVGSGEIRALCDEVERLRNIVTLARMLIQPTAVGGPILVGHQRFREDLMRAVRGRNYTDPRDTEVERLQHLEQAAAEWATCRNAYLVSEKNEPGGPLFVAMAEAGERLTQACYDAAKIAREP